MTHLDGKHRGATHSRGVGCSNAQDRFYMVPHCPGAITTLLVLRTHPKLPLPTQPQHSDFLPDAPLTHCQTQWTKCTAPLELHTCDSTQLLRSLSIPTLTLYNTKTVGVWDTSCSTPCSTSRERHCSCVGLGCGVQAHATQLTLESNVSHNISGCQNTDLGISFGATDCSCFHHAPCADVF